MDRNDLFDGASFDEKRDHFDTPKEAPQRKQVDPNKPLVKRLFVGNLNNLSSGETLENLVEDLMKRFEKYGKVLMKKEDPTRSTVHIGKSFVHVTMKFENLKNYQLLIKSYNNINYKGNVLCLQDAKPSYQEKLAHEIKQNQLIDINKYNKELIRKDYEHYKKMQNIKMSFRDRLQVIPGRNRVTKRNYVKSDKDEKTGKLVKYNKQRKQTFRIYLNGTLKVFQLSAKKKLWGVQKGRSLKDLVFQFDPNTLTWKNGLGHTIEHLNYNKLSRKERVELENQKQEAVVEEEEENINTDFLTNIFNRIDFDKKVEVGEDGIGDKDEYGSDYEMKHGIYDDDDSDAEEERQRRVIAENIAPSSGPNSDTSSSSDSDVSLESNSEDSQSESEQPEKEAESSSEDEFMPTFGLPKTKPTETISNTETLRGLFQTQNTESEKSSGLKLIVDDDDDIDHEKDNELNTLAEDAKNLKSLETQNSIVTMSSTFLARRDVGLFFPHFNSFFMQPQTALNKVKVTQIETFENWDEKFWDNRAQWTNEFKQRKRAELKKLRKKQSTSNVLL